ncbi:MAG: sulfotransferase [Mucilaginibacter sp.]
MQSKTLMVVGMHRSGTSLITNWLYRCGLQVGEHLVEANDGNVEGHFEDVEFLRMHEEILASNDLSMAGMVYDKEINISVYQIEKLKSVIKIKNRRYKQWGWKEPRTCLFLDTYRELLPQSKYLVIVRDYTSVVNSLLKREFGAIERKYFSRGLFGRFIWTKFRRYRRKQKYYRDNAERFLKVWIEYNEHILSTLKVLAPEDYLVINYALLEEFDQQVFFCLTKKWRFALQYFSFKEVYKENLISGTIDLSPFISDKELLSKAKNLQNAFEQYISLVK